MSEPQKYRKKPVVIEAMRMAGGSARCMEVAYWMVDNGYPWLIGNALEPSTLHYRGDDPEAEDWEPPAQGVWIDPDAGSLMIRTMEGDMRVNFGDYVIRGVKGEFYPCKPDIFAATYEEAAK